MRNKAKPVDLLKFDKEIFDTENKPSVPSDNETKRRIKTKKVQSKNQCSLATHNSNKRIDSQKKASQKPPSSNHLSSCNTSSTTFCNTLLSTPSTSACTPNKSQENYTLYLNDNRDKFWTEDTMSRISTGSLNDSSLLLNNSCDNSSSAIMNTCLTINTHMMNSSNTSMNNNTTIENTNSILIKNQDVQWASPVVESDNEILLPSSSLSHKSSPDLNDLKEEQNLLEQMSSNSDEDFLSPDFNFDDSINPLFNTQTVQVDENEPEKILQLYDYYGEFKFLIKWKNIDTAEYISTHIANLKYPQYVIKFYEEKLVFQYKISQLEQSKCNQKLAQQQQLLERHSSK